MKTPFGSFGLPPDAVAWTAAVLGIVSCVAVVWQRERLGKLLAVPNERWLVAALALVAAALSAGYVGYYLGGAPRIIDATSYFLEARSLAEGHLDLPVIGPSGSFRGRFLITPPGEPNPVVIFPPGYPAVLAVGFLLGVPLAIGPCLAALLVVATYALARQLFQRRDVALLAASLSVLSAALRYHTADTMSHGLSALLVTVALWGALRKSTAAWLVAGGCSGWLIATRPVTGLVVTAAVGVLALRHRQGRWLFSAALLPGLGWLLVHQHAATGQWLASSQVHYYALSDGPPGCFRYGFGQGIGCVFEHGDVVERFGGSYGPGDAVINTLRRLRLHVMDLGNFEPLALLIPFAAVAARKTRGVAVLAGCVLAVLLAYAPFYFDGSYPGGGARLFADVLPVEHVLLAWALIRLGLTRWVAAAALLGFAVHASYDHRQLRDREGGRPMYEPAVVARAGVDHGLVFVDTDHGFNLGYDPGSLDPTKSVMVARHRGDAHDFVLWTALGKPKGYRYQFSPYAADGNPGLAPYTPAPSSRFELEAEWPPLDVPAGWAHPAYPGEACVSGRRGLRLRPVGDRPASIVVEIVVPRAGDYDLTAGWLGVSRSPAEVAMTVGRHRASHTQPSPKGHCWRLTTRLRLPAGRQAVRLHAGGAGAVADYLEVQPSAPGSSGKMR